MVPRGKKVRRQKKKQKNLRPIEWGRDEGRFLRPITTKEGRGDPGLNKAGNAHRAK